MLASLRASFGIGDYRRPGLWRWSCPFRRPHHGFEGVVYGVTVDGGIDPGPCNIDLNLAPGCGTVFSLSPPSVAGGTWTETALYAFPYTTPPAHNGFYPVGTLSLLNNGNLMGMATAGGKYRRRDCPGSGGYHVGCGMLFELAPAFDGRR